MQEEFYISTYKLIFQSTIVWDPKNQKTDKFSFHSSSALDVDWISDDFFASCSVDRSIHICQLGMSVPFKTFYVSLGIQFSFTFTFQGHENEVNAVKFDKVSRRLASCSDDRTLKARFRIFKMSNQLFVLDLDARGRQTNLRRKGA